LTPASLTKLSSFLACLVKTTPQAARSCSGAGLRGILEWNQCKTMKLVLEKDVASLTDFARNTRKYTETLARTRRPRVLTHNCKPAAVVMSPAAFEELVGDAEEHRLNLRLQASLAAYAKGGRGQPATKAFQPLRNRLR
jgi:PHD/YefM family antitoxin component YafN of YafNO toxin-antitoxin module